MWGSPLDWSHIITYGGLYLVLKELITCCSLIKSTAGPAHIGVKTCPIQRIRCPQHESSPAFGSIWSFCCATSTLMLLMSHFHFLYCFFELLSFPPLLIISIYTLRRKLMLWILFQGQGACNFKSWHDLLGKGSEGAVARELKFSDTVTRSHHGERRASLSSGPSNSEILDMVAYRGHVGEQPESVVREVSM